MSRFTLRICVAADLVTDMNAGMVLDLGDTSIFGGISRHIWNFAPFIGPKD